MVDCRDGHPTPEGAAFCPTCGVRSVPDVSMCPNGHEVPAGASFCPECGGQVRSTAMDVQPPEPNVAKRKQTTCASGHEMPEDGVWCLTCGAPTKARGREAARKKVSASKRPRRMARNAAFVVVAVALVWAAAYVKSLDLAHQPRNWQEAAAEKCGNIDWSIAPGWRDPWDNGAHQSEFGTSEKTWFFTRRDGTRVEVYGRSTGLMVAGTDEIEYVESGVNCHPDS